jgi:N-acetylmuramoyl-L-alanine amidase
MLLILSTVPAFAPPVKNRVNDIRYWTGPERTRVVLDMSSESCYRLRVLTNPHRIVVDVKDGYFAGGLRSVEVGDGVIERIRVNRLRSIAQVVLDLPRATPFKDFALRPYKGKPHRIVIDVKKILSNDEIKLRKSRIEEVANSGDFIVVIDPGHGGFKPGTCHYGLLEKEIVLDVSRMLRNELGKYDGIKCVMTRDGDYHVGLQRRVEIAREHEGNCFVSVHVNALDKSRMICERIRGSEVYFLSVSGASDENARRVAERENLMLSMGEENGVLDDDVKSILVDLNRNNTIHQSSLLAEKISYRFKEIGSIPFRGVMQANFNVLNHLGMPSVLVEMAYLTNSKDSRLLRKRGVRKDFARRMSLGIVDYIRRYHPENRVVLKSGKLIHVVAKGETLWQIARKYNISLKELRGLNELDGGSKIVPGQKLRVLR